MSKTKTLDEFVEQFRVKPGKNVNLKKDFDPGFHGEYFDKNSAADALQEGIVHLAEWQEKLYAEGKRSLLIIFQAMDAAGKDSTIKHVMSGLNPQGCQVTSFKSPSAQELSYGYLWRCAKAVPSKGFIGIFNRSYYEEVLVTKVHPEILDAQKLPDKEYDNKFWKRRYDQINGFEDYLTSTGTTILKFFLNVSAQEQKKRFLERLKNEEKNWKFSTSDLKERACWDKYQDAFNDMLSATSTAAAPWYVVPADKKWFTRLAVAATIYLTLEDLNPQFPAVSEIQKASFADARKALESRE
ncbi:MAG: polyphosphate kinase 2 family protein [Thermoguttaceae bacterium]|nr:polyphosphate kinase 2 family protein [Thermoguttaceae bacterium]